MKSTELKRLQRSRRLVLALVPLVFVLNSTKPKATAEAAISSSSQR